MRMTFSHTARSSCAEGPPPMMPTLLASPVRPPSSLTARSITSRAPSGCDTSPATGTAANPSASIALQTSAALSSITSLTATVAPAAATACEMASPIPEPPPVTTTLPPASGCPSVVICSPLIPLCRAGLQLLAVGRQQPAFRHQLVDPRAEQLQIHGLVAIERLHL